MRCHIKKELETAFEPPEPKGREIFLSQLSYPKMTYPEFIFSQIGYIRKRIWIVSLAVLSAAAFVACFASEEVKLLLWLTAAIMPFLALLTASEISRSGIFGMSEMEAGCRFSLTQVVGARMIILGICNFIIIITVSILSGVFTPFGFAKSVLYIFAPYITVNGCSLMIFNRVKGQDGIYLAAAAALGVSLVGTVIYNGSTYYGRFTNLIVFAACIGGILTAFVQMKKILFGKERYLWN